MKVCDLFSGYGGFTLGIKQAYVDRFKQNEQRSGTENGLLSLHNKGWTKWDEEPDSIGFSEIEKHPIAVLKYHFPNIKNYGDISLIDSAQLPDFDLLTGGSPCQDLSVAGKQAGLSGSRSGLFFQYIRLLKEKQPKNYIWENVKGALSSSDGWDFARVQIEMAEAGYSFQWQILNAKYFGVPQNRERVFVIGSLGDRCSGEVFFEQTDGGKNLDELTQNASQSYRVYGSDGISTTIASGAGGVGAKTGLYARTIRVGGAGSPHGSKQNWDSYEIKGRIRRLTPTECERLMGLPDGWTKYGVDENGKQYELSDSARYKLCGNGVVVNVVKALADLIKMLKV